MPVIDLANISKYVGARCLFSQVTFSLSRGEKVGVVGRNGEGKTTLLRIIAGEIEPDEGSLHISSGTRIGYLAQTLPYMADTVFREAMAGRKEVMDVGEKLKRLEEAMIRGTSDIDELVAEYSRTQARFESLGGYSLEHETAYVLSGLGFCREEFDLPADHLSGGQKMRLALARLLISMPDILLLDEPTNHLDIDGVEWLEEYLSGYPGTVLTVSHDRHFLDRTVSKIVELEDGRVSVYRGNYSSYVRQKEEQLAQQQELYERQQEFVRRTRELIQKLKPRYSTVGMAKSREKALERLELVEKPKAHKTIKVEMEPASLSGTEVLRIKGLSKSYDDKVLFKDFSALVLRGERIALIGPNGCGKTTFLKCIQGLEDVQGAYQWGTGVDVAYFSQELSFSSDDVTLVDELKLQGLTENEARAVLGRFLFSGEDAFKKIGDISGGEKSRLALAKIVVSGANVLLLDEPTNHLDLPSRNALESALQDFGGTIIFSSHDRYFIDTLATRLFVFENGSITDIKGNYTQFRTVRDSEQRQLEREVQVRLKETKPKDQVKPARVVEKKLREIYSQVAALEEEISKLERRKNDIEEIFAAPESYNDPASLPYRELEEVARKLSDLYSQWERLETEKESLCRERDRVISTSEGGKSLRQ